MLQRIYTRVAKPAARYTDRGSAAPPANPQWVPCNGQPLYCLDAKQPQRTKGVLSEGNRQDYIRALANFGLITDSTTA